MLFQTRLEAVIFLDSAIVEIKSQFSLSTFYFSFILISRYSSNYKDIVKYRVSRSVSIRERILSDHALYQIIFPLITVCKKLSNYLEKLRLLLY